MSCNAGALKTLGSSRDAPLPVKLFEVADVVLTAPLETSQVGAVNRRRLVALTCDRTSGFEIIHGLLNRVMEVLGVSVLDESESKFRAPPPPFLRLYVPLRLCPQSKCINVTTTVWNVERHMLPDATRSIITRSRRERSRDGRRELGIQAG